MNISLDLNILTKSFTKWDGHNKATIPGLGTSIPIGMRQICHLGIRHYANGLTFVQDGLARTAKRRIFVTFCVFCMCIMLAYYRYFSKSSDYLIDTATKFANNVNWLNFPERSSISCRSVLTIKPQQLIVLDTACTPSRYLLQIVQTQLPRQLMVELSTLDPYV